VQPTVQWKNQQVPIPMFGISSQATNSTFGKDTNDAANGVLYQGVSGPGVAVTEKSIPFAEGFKTKFGNYPSYAGYTAYDEVYYIADAVKRAGATDADKLVEALEKTDWEGTIGRVQFYGKDDPFTHSIKYGPGLITGLMLQWQDGQQVAVWPKDVAKAEMKFPSFIKLTSN
jgi:branched-chain amino acid transport system substrate-binding protein